MNLDETTKEGADNIVQLFCDLGDDDRAKRAAATMMLEGHLRLDNQIRFALQAAHQRGYAAGSRGTWSRFREWTQLLWRQLRG